MTDIEISSMQEFMKAIEDDTIEYKGIPLTKTRLYRGVPNNEKHKLIPSIGRGWKESLKKLRGLEMGTLEMFKKRAVPYLDYRPANDWEWLMLGQHHQLQTRLLDWTTNPLVALYFACVGDNHLSVDGTVYRRRGDEQFFPERYTDSTLPSPLDIDKDYMVFPPYISPRIAAQAGVFTISKNPVEPLPIIASDEYATNDKILVKADSKNKLLRQLSDLDVTVGSLFPDLDGLCKLGFKLQVQQMIAQRIPQKVF
jgi:hypothetical protein